jgi:SAM-dependent methyltransferase
VTSEFDRYAQSYRDIITHHAALVGEPFEYFIEVRLNLLQALLGTSTPARVLDYGCGIGATEQAMRRRWPNAAIDGVDTSAGSLASAEALQVPNARFHLLRSGEKLPFGDGTFDVVYSNGTFHHIDHGEHPAVFREITRVLRPGGHAFVCENNPYNPVTVWGMHRAPLDADAKMLFPFYLARLQRCAGLQVEATRFYVFYPKHLKFLRWTEKYLARVPLGAQYFVWGTKPTDGAGEVLSTAALDSYADVEYAAASPAAELTRLQ